MCKSKDKLAGSVSRNHKFEKLLVTSQDRNILATALPSKICRAVIHTQRKSHIFKFQIDLFVKLYQSVLLNACYNLMQY